MQVPVIVRPSPDGGFWAEVPTMPGCVSQGETLEATIANVRGAIQVWLAYLRDKGLPLPEQDVTIEMVQVDV